MQNASKVANGYKTILSNLMTKDLEDQFNEFGLTMRDQNGEMKDAFTILEELAGAYNNIGTTIDETTGETVSLNDSMNQLLDDIAGAHNINVLTSGFDNFEQAINATESAMNSAGSASNEYAIALDTIKMKSEAVLGQLQQLVIGEGGLQSFIKALLDGATTILEFINDIGGLKTVLITVTGLLIAFKGALVLDKASQVLSFITNLTSGIKGLTSIIPNAITAWSAYSAGIVSANTAMQASMPIIGLLTIALGALSMGISEYKQSQEEARQEALSSIDSLNSYVDSIEESINTINAETTSKEQLINMISQLDSAYDTEKAQLEDINALREEAIAKIYQESLAKAQETVKETGSEYSESKDFLGSNYSSYQTPELKLKALSDEIDKYNQKIEKGEELTKSEELALRDLESQYSSLKDEIDEAKDIVEGYEDAQKLLEDGNDELDDALASLGKKFNRQTGQLEDLTDAEKEAYEQRKKLTKEEEEANKASKNTLDSLKDSISETDKMNQATQEEQDIISSLSSQLDEIVSAYQLAADAQYEYNQQGYLSVDTYSQLMSLKPQYLAWMFDENGALYANADATVIAAQAKVQEMGIAAARAQISLAESLYAEGKSYAAVAQGALNAADAEWELVRAEAAAAIMSDEDRAVLNSKIDAINSLTKSTMANVGAVTSSYQPINRNTSANNRNTGARKSNADATKAQTEALKAQKEALEAEADALEKELDDYEIVIDYVKDLLKEEQEAVEEEKDAQLEAIQDKIDALEEEQEAFEENIDAQIEALEKQKDETEDYWDAQIEAIQDANDALEENMELQRLQEALANAKSQKVKVLKGGRFVYAEDEEAISKAEQDLADYEMQLAVQRQIEELERLKEEALNSLENQIEELENYRDEQKKNYEQQLKDLQDHYDAVEEEYDKRIKQYDAWLKEFEDMLEASSKRHAEILYNELVGEQGNWDARIKALGNFVKSYEAKKNELDGIKKQIEAIDNQIKALQASSANSIDTMNTRLGQAQNLQNQIAALANSSIERKRYYVHDSKGTNLYATKKYADWYPAWQESENWISKNKDMLGGSYGSTLTTEYYAEGTYEVPDDRIALVADPLRPSNRELVVGSKINKGDGVLSSLKKGSGVIPAGRNLTENLVNLAKWSSSGGFERTFTTMNQSSSKVVHIENINLPNVQNGEDFVNYLEMNFVNDAIQYSNIRE